MRINKKKFIYLISPNKIYPEFYHDLNQILRTGKVALFQLRLKKYSLKQKIVIGKKIQQICKKNSTKFLVNDDPILSKKLNADGCHLGQKDMDIKNARKIIGNKIIGASVSFMVFVFMPLFIYHRWNGKKLSDYTFSNENLKKMKAKSSKSNK